MRKQDIIIPAIKLPDGEILKGQPHLVLALKAISDGVDSGIVSGFINKKGIFKSIYPKPEETIPYLVSTPRYAYDLLNRCSYIFYEAAKALILIGREDAENLKLLVDRFESFDGVPMTSAIQSPTGEVFYGGYTHGEITAQHPDLDGQFVTGFKLLETGEFVDREMAARVLKQWTGQATNERNMISGEEWVPKLETEDDAYYFGENMHSHGLHHADMRSKLYERMNRDPEHKRLLDIALKVRKGL